MMGNSFGDGYFNELPVHEVCLTQFSIAKFTVTRGEFGRFVRETKYQTDAEIQGGCYIYREGFWRKEDQANWRSPGFTQDDNHPVVCVSWHDAVTYAQWLSQTSKRHFRLPTEAEWEYAARSGGKHQRYAGSDTVDAVAWYAANATSMTHPVGQKQANGLGLFDMSGNVWQWTADWYGAEYYRRSPRMSPVGPTTGTKKVFRGGSWFFDARGVRTTYRDFYFPDYCSSYLGFRLATSD
jgi:formylglycine-generating enzyme required for sulfatase activity